MNDFTKDELKDIQDVLRLWVLKDTESSIREISNKIESMIDHYCGHDWRKGEHLFNDIYCSKCDEHFEVTNDNQ